MQELNNGRWSIKTKGGQEVVDGVDEIQLMGRGQRVRKPRKAVWLM